MQHTLYAFGDNLEEVIYKLDEDIENASYWFHINKMIANPNKFQLMFVGTKKKIKLCLKINGKSCLNIICEDILVNIFLIYLKSHF